MSKCTFSSQRSKISLNENVRPFKFTEDRVKNPPTTQPIYFLTPKPFFITYLNNILLLPLLYTSFSFSSELVSFKSVVSLDIALLLSFFTVSVFSSKAALRAGQQLRHWSRTTKINTKCFDMMKAFPKCLNTQMLGRRRYKPRCSLSPKLANHIQGNLIYKNGITIQSAVIEWSRFVFLNVGNWLGNRNTIDLAFAVKETPSLEHCLGRSANNS